MVSKFSECDEISKMNKGKFSEKDSPTLQPYLFVRGSRAIKKAKVKLKNLVCGDCGDPLTSSYTESLGLCVGCYNK